MKYIVWDVDEHSAGSETQCGIAIAKAKFYGDIYAFYKATTRIDFFSNDKEPRKFFEKKHYSEVSFPSLTSTMKQEFGVLLKNNLEVYVEIERQDPLYQDIFFQDNHLFYRYLWWSSA